MNPEKDIRTMYLPECFPEMKIKRTDRISGLRKNTKIFIRLNKITIALKLSTLCHILSSVCIT